MVEYLEDSGVSLGRFFYDKHLIDLFCERINLPGQTLQIIASNEALTRERNAVVSHASHAEEWRQEQRFQSFLGKVDEVNDSIRYGLEELAVTFRWGFSEVLTKVGTVAASLDSLIEINSTPSQIAAYEHFEIARENFRKGLYDECLARLKKAVEGDHVSPGYPEGWEFHYLQGIVFLGSVEIASTDSGRALIDSARAEESFLLAQRYARVDHPQEAARAMLSASWAAYTLGELERAQQHIDTSLELDPTNESFFHKARLLMAQDEPKDALGILKKLIESKPLYLLKAAGDDCFQKHQGVVDDFLSEYQDRLWRKLLDQINKYREELLEGMVFADVAHHPVMQQWDKLAKAGPLAILDIIDYRKNKVDKEYWVVKKDKDTLDENIRKMRDCLGIVEEYERLFPLQELIETLDEIIRRKRGVSDFVEEQESLFPLRERMSQSVKTWRDFQLDSIGLLDYVAGQRFRDDEKAITIFLLQSIKRKRKEVGDSKPDHSSPYRINQLDERHLLWDELRQEVSYLSSPRYQGRLQIKGELEHALAEYGHLDKESVDRRISQVVRNWEALARKRDYDPSYADKFEQDKQELQALVDQCRQYKFKVYIPSNRDSTRQIEFWDRFLFWRVRQYHYTGKLVSKGTFVLSNGLGESARASEFACFDAGKLSNSLFRGEVDPFEIQCEPVSALEWEAVMGCEAETVDEHVYVTRRDAVSYCHALSKICGADPYDDRVLRKHSPENPGFRLPSARELIYAKLSRPIDFNDSIFRLLSSSLWCEEGIFERENNTCNDILSKAPFQPVRSVGILTDANVYKLHAASDAALSGY